MASLAEGSSPAAEGVTADVTSSVDVLAVNVGGVRCGFLARDVVGVHRAARPQPLPGAPVMVEGILNIRGEIVTLLDLRRRLGLPPQALRAFQHLVVLRSGERCLAVRVERAETVLVTSGDAICDAPAEGGELPARGVARLPDGLLLIYDPARFLSTAEAESLDAALAKVSPSGPDGGDG